MQITWLGQSCFKIEAKSGDEEVTIVTYPFDTEKTGLKLPRALTADIVLQQGPTLAHPVETRDGKRPFIISGPGEYEAKGVFVYAIPMLPEAGTSAHLFRIEAENIVLVHPGPLLKTPSETELQALENLDILFVPVGGHDTLDAKAGNSLVSELEPRLVIPMQFKVEGLKTKADDVTPFLKMVGAKSETMPKLKIARKDLPADETRVVVLEKS